ncbi:hypothetical protein A2U01_0119586, partial [Trifolium medium]|nr:hypothetical protein [Trifolium medium]
TATKPFRFVLCRQAPFLGHQVRCVAIGRWLSLVTGFPIGASSLPAARRG